MGRERRDFVRRSGFRDANLFVIATEGAIAEPRYFNGLKERWKNPRLHIEVITRDDASASSPTSVLGALDRFAVEFMLRDGDQLWLVVDRDSQSWKPREMAEVARSSGQKRYFLAVSNPCFEVWLLVHFENLSHQSAKRREELFENKAGLLKREVNRCLAAQKEYIDHFLPHIDRAIERSKALDTKPRERWPSGLGTRVYRLVEQLQPKGG
jgi:RloB-like protein